MSPAAVRTTAGRHILPRDLPFTALEDQVARAGWRRMPIPGLRPPLVAGEPELARFERGAEVIHYSFNPAIGLRVVDGPLPAGLPRLGPGDITSLLASDDPAAVLCGILAAAELELDELAAPARDAAARLPARITPLAARALARLGPGAEAAPEAPPASLLAYDALPIRARRDALRRAIDRSDPAVAALISRSFDGDAELAATAAIGAARLGLRDVAAAIERRPPPSPSLPPRERELLLAVARAALATLAGRRPGPEHTPRNRLWRAVLGEGGEDAIAMAVDALIAPPPLPTPAVALPGTTVELVRVEAVPHWLGGDGRANPVRRWTPPAPFLIGTGPLPATEPAAGIAAGGAVGADEIDPILERLSARTGRLLRLPEADEWEAALRGPDGRPRPWGLDLLPPDGDALSPWGAGPPDAAVGEWARSGGDLVVCGLDPEGGLAVRVRPAAGARHRLRIVART